MFKGVKLVAKFQNIKKLVYGKVILPFLKLVRTSFVL